MAAAGGLRAGETVMSLRFVELSTALLSPLRARSSARLFVRAESRAVPTHDVKAKEMPVWPTELVCLRNDSESTTRLQISGALDIHSAPEIRPIFDAVVASKKRCVTLDLDGLTMVDSSGVGAIVSLFKRVKASGGALVVEGIHGQPL